MIPVVADADTLFGATTRGLLIHLDYQGLIRLHWSPLILDEMSRALVDTGRKPDAESARRHELLMRAALPQAEIPTQQVQAQFATVAPTMRSAKDTHVAACAAAILVNRYYADNQVVSLVTKNIRDFGVRKLATIGIDVQRPDGFLLQQFKQKPAAVAAAFAALRSSLRSAPAPERLLESKQALRSPPKCFFVLGDGGSGPFLVRVWLGTNPTQLTTRNSPLPHPHMISLIC